MLNVFHMEICRAFKAKSFYISIVVAFLIQAALFLTLSGTMNESFNAVSDVDKVSTVYDMGEGGRVSLSINQSMAGDACPSNVVTALIVICITVAGVFASCFMSDFYKNGYYKNVAGRKKHKSFFVIARTGVYAVYSLIILAVNTIVLICLAFLKIDSFELTHMKEFFMFMAALYLLTVATCVFCSLLTELTKAKLTAIVYVFFINANILQPVINNINSKLSDWFSSDINIADYFATIHLQSFNGSLPLENSKVIHAVVLACCSIVFYNIINSVLLAKRSY